MDEDFAGLALDSCALVFLIICECDKYLDNNEKLPDIIKWGTGEISESVCLYPSPCANLLFFVRLLVEIRTFVEKRTKRNFLKRHWKHTADDQKVDQYREKLKNWMVKLEVCRELTPCRMIMTMNSRSKKNSPFTTSSKQSLTRGFRNMRAIFMLLGKPTMSQRSKICKRKRPISFRAVKWTTHQQYLRSWAGNIQEEQTSRKTNRFQR